MAERTPGLSAEDVAVSLAVRADLGAEHEPAVIAEFLDRVGVAIDERVDARVAERVRVQPGGLSRLVLPLSSLVLGIPITAIAASQGLGALIISWGGIAAINVADALRR